MVRAPAPPTGAHASDQQVLHDSTLQVLGDRTSTEENRGHPIDSTRQSLWNRWMSYHPVVDSHDGMEGIVVHLIVPVSPGESLESIKPRAIAEATSPRTDGGDIHRFPETLAS